MLPKNLQYKSKLESANAKSYRSSIAPMNGTGSYGLNDTITINVPTGGNKVLVPSESFLKFSFQIRNQCEIFKLKKYYYFC